MLVREHCRHSALGVRHKFDFSINHHYIEDRSKDGPPLRLHKAGHYTSTCVQFQSAPVSSEDEPRFSGPLQTAPQNGLEQAKGMTSSGYS
jgi:hypothetical protein